MILILILLSFPTLMGTIQSEQTTVDITIAFTIQVFVNNFAFFSSPNVIRWNSKIIETKSDFCLDK